MRAKGRALLHCTLLLAGTRCHSGFSDRFLAQLLEGTVPFVVPTPYRAIRGASSASRALVLSPCPPPCLSFQGIVKLEHPRIHVDFPVIICEV